LLVDTREDWSLRVEEGVLVVEGGNIVARETLHHQEGVLVVEGGNIVAREHVDLLDELILKYKVDRDRVHFLKENEFLLPGFIDTHIHASQFPNLGIALDLPLLEWLERYTFPTESRLGSPSYASLVYHRAVRCTLDHGTTTAVYFATIHQDSSMVLARVVQELGQRALVGKVCMDRNSPDFYCEETSHSLTSTKEFVDSVLSLSNPLVQPIVTPRFVPSCSRELMKGLGDLAREKDLHVTSHIGESRPEVRWVKELEPDCQNYAEVYSKCGLLHSKTILAHGVYLTDEELSLMSESGAGVSHCGNSNNSLRSGVADVRRMVAKGVKVGLGTDCSGGYSPSILNSMRSAVTASNLLSIHHAEPPASNILPIQHAEDEAVKYEPLNYSDVLYLATRGGAQLIDMKEQLGALEIGMQFDCLLVDMEGNESTRPFGHETKKDLIQKFVFLRN